MVEKSLIDRINESEDAGIDSRPIAPWEEPIQMNRPHHCSVGSCANYGNGHWLTKHVWGNRPLGQYFTRCQKHQDLRDRKGGRA